MNKHKRYKDKNREKISAQNRAYYLYRGKQICSIEECEEIAERHHPDYNKPSEVIFLCRKHHREEHGFIKNKCSVKSCGNLTHAKGLCKNHYARKFRKIQSW